MQPSHYNYLKRMWTRNYPKRSNGVISTILLFPLKLCIFITATVILTGLYIVFYGALFVLKCILEFLKILFIFFKDLIVGIFQILKNKYFNS